MAHFVTSRKKAVQQHDALLAICDKVSYSLKTNPEVGRVLYEDTACDFSMHSIELSGRIADKSRVWLFAQGWDKDEILGYIKQGIRRFVCDNPSDLETLQGFLDESNANIDLLLRMRLKEYTVQTGKHFVFGMFSREIEKYIPVLRKNKNIGRLGIHFHRKTQNLTEWSLSDELKASISDENRKLLDIVNIGGGLPISYKNSKADNLPEIFQKIRTLREFLGNKIQLMIEPGRFIAGPSTRLVTRIKSISGNNIILDASVYNSANDTFVSHVRLEVEGELESGNAYTLKGSTPCSMDIFRYKVFLDSPKSGDEIVFLNAGAYNFSSDFCDLKPLRTLIL